jgi:hypothetical protein
MEKEETYEEMTERLRNEFNAIQDKKMKDPKYKKAFATYVKKMGPTFITIESFVDKKKYHSHYVIRVVDNKFKEVWLIKIKSLDGSKTAKKTLHKGILKHTGLDFSDVINEAKYYHGGIAELKERLLLQFACERDLPFDLKFKKR